MPPVPLQLTELQIGTPNTKFKDGMPLQSTELQTGTPNRKFKDGYLNSGNTLLNAKCINEIEIIL